MSEGTGAIALRLSPKLKLSQTTRTLRRFSICVSTETLTHPRSESQNEGMRLKLRLKIKLDCLGGCALKSTVPLNSVPRDLLRGNRPAATSSHIQLTSVNNTSVRYRRPSR